MGTLNPSGLRNQLFISFARLLQGQVEAAAEAAERVPAGWGGTPPACARLPRPVGRTDAALNHFKTESSAHAPIKSRKSMRSAARSSLRMAGDGLPDQGHHAPVAVRSSAQAARRPALAAARAGWASPRPTRERATKPSP
jgi:hypothetical protein